MNITFVPNAGAGCAWTEQGRVGSPLPPGSATWGRGAGNRINALIFVCPCGCRDVWHIPVSDGTPLRPIYPLRDLTDDEKVRHAVLGYVKFEAYPPEDDQMVVGRFWTQVQLNGVSDEQAWKWDGNEAKPTLTPSILRKSGCRWHGYLTGGEFRTC